MANKKTTPPAKSVRAQLDDAGRHVFQSLHGEPGQKRFLLVIALALIFGGWLGSILNGQTKKGVLELAIGFFAATAALFTLIALSATKIFMLLFPLVGLYNLVLMLDSILIANRITKGEKFGDWDFCWKPVAKA